MNMAVNKVRKSAEGLARKRLGTKAHFPIKASPPVSSAKNITTCSAIKAYVTSGAVLRELLSSPIGNMRFISFYSHLICHRFTCNWGCLCGSHNVDQQDVLSCERRTSPGRRAVHV